MHRILPLPAVVLLLTSLALPVQATVGEFSIPAVSPLGPDRLAALRELVRTDPEAATLAQRVADEARPAVDAQPQPLAVIHYEGLVNTDPRRIATVAKLREMGDVARLVRHWQATGDPQAADTLVRFIMAWTDTYRITGNDVNENKFYPLLVAYHGLRPTMSDAQRQPVDAWVQRLGEEHEKAVLASRNHFSNRYTKHVRLLALAGMILDRPAWVEAAHDGIRRFIDHSLFAGGESVDLRRRDTLTYHGSALKPVLELAMLSGPQGRTLYTWEGEQGGSLEQSVDYVVPYALGEKTHEEWVNTKSGLDRRRAEAGLEKYRPGRLYDPADARELMVLASFFDPDLLRVVRHLDTVEGNEPDRFPDWQTLINAAAAR